MFSKTKTVQNFLKAPIIKVAVVTFNGLIYTVLSSRALDLYLLFCKYDDCYQNLHLKVYCISMGSYFYSS